MTERSPEVAQGEMLVSSLRVLTAQFRLAANQVDSIGVALRGGAITPDAALEWLDELNMLACLPMAEIILTEPAE